MLRIDVKKDPRVGAQRVDQGRLRPGWRRRRLHELTDGIKEGTDGRIVALDTALKIGQFAGEFLVKGEGFAQPDKHAHDGDIDLDGGLTAQNA